jgi:hypothetical protein
MYYRRMQQIRRDAHQRRVHEARRAQRAEAQREQVRAIVHAAVR